MYKRPSSAEKFPKPRLAKVFTLPAPTMGLNQRDPVSAMPPLFALNLTNFIATPQGSTVREGYKVRNTGLPSYVNTLASYYPNTGSSNKCFAWSGTAIYDVSSPGAVGTAVVTGLTNSTWNTVSMSTAGGAYLICANGVDAVRHYNGSAWVTWVADATPTNPGEVDGVSVSTLNHPILHQRRLWFVQENSTKGWYLPVDSLGGVAAAIDFGPAFPRGGKLAQMASWSIDGGQGLKNFLAAISTNGDLVIYEGTDPSSAADWTISATWQLGKPTTAKCIYQYGGELLFNSLDGLLPLSKYMQNKQTEVALSDAIRSVFATLSETFGELSGWHMSYIPTRNILVVNVPQTDPLRNFQLVFNTVTSGWSLFTGWPAQCWGSFGTTTLFGSYQQVCTAFSGYKDGASNAGVGGTTYVATGQQAFNYVSDITGNKHFTMARVNLTSATSSPLITIGANTDFSSGAPTSAGVIVPISDALYDVAFWDDALWVGGIGNYNAWQTIAASGYCVSITISISVAAATNWISTDIVYEAGGVFT